MNLINMMRNIHWKNQKSNLIIIGISAIILNINTKNIILNLCLYSFAMIALAIVSGNLNAIMGSYIGVKKGGLLASTIGNIPELFMGFWSIKIGMISIVKFSLIGAIISNMLLVLL